MERPRYPVFVGLKLPADLAHEVQRAARADDRTVSSLIRKLLAAALTPPPGEKQASGDAR